MTIREACFHKLFCHLNSNTCWHNETANDKQLVPKLMSIYVAVRPLHTLHFSFITQQRSLAAAGSAGSPSCPLICRTFVSSCYFSSLYFVLRVEKKSETNSTDGMTYCIYSDCSSRTPLYSFGSQIWCSLKGC